MYLPNLELLLFLVVLALPKASIIGFVAKENFHVLVSGTGRTVRGTELGLSFVYVF